MSPSRQPLETRPSRPAAIVPPRQARRVFAARPVRNLVALAALALASLSALAAELLHADHPLAGRIWDMRASTFIDETALLPRLAGASILLLGETHDNPEHHRLQRRLLDARLAAGALPALILEQFDQDRQTAIDAARAGDADADALARAAAIAKTWDWPDYRPFVEAALAHKLPIVAANPTREQLRPVIRGGFADLDPAELARLQIEAAWSKQRQSYLSKLIETSHCGMLDAKLRDGLVRAQRLRDAIIADLTLPHAARGAVAILGRGHARRDIGVPRYLAIRQPGIRSLAIGFVEVSPDKPEPADYEAERGDPEVPYDLIWFTPRAARVDPCANFGRRS